MRRWLLLFLLLAFGFAALGQSAPASPAGRINPADVIGTWELNLHNSSWGTLPPPKSATIKILRFDENGMQWTAEETDENGNTIEANWQGPLDGLPVKATGTDEEVNYAFQQTDEGILEVTTFPDGARITSLGDDLRRRQNSHAASAHDQPDPWRGRLDRGLRQGCTVKSSLTWAVAPPSTAAGPVSCSEKGNRRRGRRRYKV